MSITNTLSFPAAGYRYGTDVNYRGSYGYYWSGAATGLGSAYDLIFYEGLAFWNYDDRYYGLSVRPVSE